MAQSTPTEEAAGREVRTFPTCSPPLLLESMFLGGKHRVEKEERGCRTAGHLWLSAWRRMSQPYHPLCFILKRNQVIVS